jgi:hypothetical protein
MKQLRILLPAINLLIFVLVSASFVFAHGGLKGDAVWVVGGTDTVAEPADKGLVLFNRWNFSGNREPIFTRAFLYINSVAFLLARSILSLLALFSEQFQTNQPLGLSYGTYTLLLAVPLSLLQWFGIGFVLDSARKCRAG